MKTNQMIEPVISPDFQTVEFRFRTLGVQTLTMAKVSPEIKNRAACVGLTQVRVVDAAAVSRTDKNGKVRTTDEMEALKWTRISELIAHLESGTTEWSRVRSASGETGGYLFEALCEMYAGKQSAEEIRKFLDSLTNAEQAALRDDEEVAPYIAKIKAKRNEGKPVIDTKGLLGKIAKPDEPQA